MNEQLEKLFGANFKLKDIDSAPIANNMGLLSLNILESNEIFRYLKSELELYYREKNKSPHRQTLHAHRSSAWKEHFYLSLQTLLNEVTFTNDVQLKEFMITKIYKWYAEKSQRPLVKPRKRSPPKVKEEILYPYIPQRIESTVPTKRNQHLPKLPKALSLSKDFDLGTESDTFSEHEKNGKKEENRTERGKVFFRPFLKLQKEPVFIDFRASSVGASVDYQRSTNFTDRESLGKNTARENGERFGKFWEKNGKNCEKWTGDDESVRKKMENLAKGDDFNALFIEKNDAKVPEIRRKQFREVSIIKQRLAAKKVHIPIKVLENGLVFSDFTQEIIPPSMLPKGGELLMHEPVTESSGKKKKKKGKKTKN